MRMRACGWVVGMLVGGQWGGVVVVEVVCV